MTLTKAKPKPPTLEHRKRMGHHHRRSHDYVKTYWPYLPVVTILGLGILINGWLGQMNRSVLGYATDLSIQSLLTDTNQQRVENGESQLGLNQQLARAAQTKANDMAARNYWSHDTPDGKTPWTFITAAGYAYQAAGENLAYGFTSAGDTLIGWMNSPEHRANILNSNYRDVGFGIANIANYQNNGPETLVVAMYGTPVGVPLASQTPSSSVTTNKSTDAAQPAVQADTVTQQPISRLQLAGLSLPMDTLILVLVGCAAALLLVIRHGLAWRRALVHGEAFILRHPMFDVAAVTLVTIAMIGSHTAGLIR